MLKNSSFLVIFFWNVLIAALWHGLTLALGQRLPNSKFDESKECYAAKPWERGGRWYRENLKIQSWKDRIPQHIGKGGFSKTHLKNDSIEYLDEFILETCRGEWVHRKNCLCAIVMLLVNPLLVGLLTSLFVMIGNVPFALVQRYNRFRLQTLRKRRIREIARAGMEQNTVTA
jgi:glycosyl-4,4'-diaponeurosporenoate acyltransferase